MHKAEEKLEVEPIGPRFLSERIEERKTEVLEEAKGDRLELPE